MMDDFKTNDRAFDDGRRHPEAATAATMSPPSTGGVSTFPAAVGDAMRRLALRIRRSILEPYARRRRRRIAIAQLKRLDDWILDDIGVRRNDIGRAVDAILAGRDAAASPPSMQRDRPRRDRGSRARDPSRRGGVRRREGGAAVRLDRAMTTRASAQCLDRVADS